MNFRIELERPVIRLLISIFAIALLAKGAAAFRGFSVDDYPYAFGVSPGQLDLLIPQGRYLARAIAWAIDTLGVNLNDTYFTFGILTLFLQAALVVSILRFVGLENLPSAGLVGGMVVVHPYLAEILTFKLILPAYCAALVFTIIALESARQVPVSRATRICSLFATFAAIVTYQASFNYIAVAIFFALLYRQFLCDKHARPLSGGTVYIDRTSVLAVNAVVSALVFLAILWSSRHFAFFKLTERANAISAGDIPERIREIFSSLAKIYWKAEPIFPGWLKVLFLSLLAASLFLILLQFLSNGFSNAHRGKKLLFVILISLMPLLSLGVIIPFKGWWPVPRVVAHSGMVAGLVFLLADTCMTNLQSGLIRRTIAILRVAVLVGFVLLNNQILADQQRIAQWDRLMANRIVARLESDPNFANVRFVYVDGGSWGFPSKLSTVQDDMNISAYFTQWSKIGILTEASGYRFEQAGESDVISGRKLCSSKQPWPHPESVFTRGDLAIICLRR